MANTLLINGVETTIVADSGVREAQPETGAEATVVFQCAYSRRYDLVRGLLPRAVATNDIFVRTIPYPYPPSPNLYVHSISGIEGVAPWTDDLGWLQYREARVTAEFRTPQYQFGAGNPAGGGVDPSGLPWTTTTFKVSADVVKLPGTGYVLIGTGEPLDEQVRGVPLPQVEICMKRHWVPRIPLARMMTLAGCVNSATIQFADYTFPVGTLLFMGGPTDQAVDSAGDVVSELEYILLGRPRGIDWNAFPSRDGTWRRANTNSAGSGSFPFPYADLRTLP
jgi:hypothetical protein